MRFSIKEWRKFYDKVHALGQTLHNGRPTYNEFGGYIEPVAELSREAQMALESQIKTLTQRSSRYLDQCGIRPYPRLWKYDSKNPETQMSSPEFKYGHLIP